LVTTTDNLVYLIQNKCFSGLKQKVAVSSLMVDKVDLHLAMDLEEELIECGKIIQPYFMKGEEAGSNSKIILTTNEQDKEENFNDIKAAFLEEKKAVIVKLKDQTKSSTRFESIGHLLVKCESELQKFLILYTMLKFNVLSGRTLVFVDNLYEGYKVKILLEKFAIRSAVVNPESTKVNRKTALRYFHAGQYDILILIRMKYSYKLRISDVVNVVNFTTPQNIQDYTQVAAKLGFDNASVVTLTYGEDSKVHDNMDHKYMESLTKKMLKRYNRSLFVDLPVDWVEVNKLKSRVDDIQCTLTNKKIKNYMSNEIKKQILSNKRLKEYFNEHEDEKAILRASLSSEYKYRFLNSNLDYVPDYCFPKSILVSAIDKKIDGQEGVQLDVAEQIVGLTNDLIIVKKLNNLPKKRGATRAFNYEEPDMIDPERLAFTSGRNLWKLKHKKRIRKGIKKAKDGYMGS